MCNKNMTGGDAYGGIPKDCFKSQNSCQMQAGCGQACADSGVAGDRAVLEKVTVLPPEAQLANLNLVMAREAAGGGHLRDSRHLGDMPDFRPRPSVTHPDDVDSRQQEQTVVARGQYMS